MVDWIQNLMSSMGYVGIVILMFVENIFPPIPSEFIVPLAGFTAGRGELNLIGVILAATLGSVLGALPLYALGRVLHEDRLAEWADRYGKWLALSGRDVRRADDWFDEHGHKAVLLARVIPGIRSLISIPAGMSEMPIGKFLVYTALGSMVWTTLLAVAGFMLGENYHRVEAFVGPVSYAVLGTVVLTAVTWVVWRKQRQRTRQRS